MNVGTLARVNVEWGCGMRLVRLWDNGGAAPAGWESHVPVLWADFEPAAGVWRFDRVDAWLGAAARPCHLGLVFYMHDFVDHTPAQHRATLQVMAGDGSTGELPNYGDARWRAAYGAAIQALAERYRDDARVVAFWCALGLDQETAATAVRFAQSVQAQMTAQAYYDFIVQTTALAVAAWAPKPVYIEGAPAPGEVFGGSARFVTALALSKGAGYKMNGLTIDQADSVGLGSAAGYQKIDLVQHTQPRRLAYEAPDHGDGQAVGELYWRLVRAAAHGADFVAIQASWQAQALAVQLPATDWWVVFREREYGEQWWGAGGVSGEPGPWARGVQVVSAGAYRYNGGVGLDRWQFTCAEPLQLALAGWTAPRAQVTARGPAGAAGLVAPVVAGVVTLPAGSYYRLDIEPLADVEEEKQPTVAELAARLAAVEAQVAGLAGWRARVCEG